MTHQAKLTAAVAVILLHGASASAIMMRHDVPRAEYDALASQYAAGMFLATVDPNPSATGDDGNPLADAVCSATLISPYHVITAAHCIDGDSDGVPDGDLAELVVGFDREVADRMPSDRFSIASVDIHPAWSQSQSADFASAGDVAVLTLTSPITHIEPAKIAAFDLLGAEVTYTGYGAVTVARPDGLLLPNEAGKFNAAKNVVDDVDYRLGGFYTDMDGVGDVGINYMGSGDPLALEGSSQPGDSGGGIYASYYGEEYLVGLVSGGGAEGLPGYNEVGFNTWLGAPQTVSFLNSLGLVAVPEPSSTMAVMVIVTTLAGSRRRAVSV